MERAKIQQNFVKTVKALNPAFNVNLQGTMIIISRKKGIFQHFDWPEGCRVEWQHATQGVVALMPKGDECKLLFKIKA